MADKILHLLVGLFVGVYVARYLGPENFGILSFAMSFVALFGAFAKMGLDQIIVRNAVQDTDIQEELLGTAFALRVLGGLILLMVVYRAIRFTDSDALTQLIVMIIAVGYVLQAFQVIEFYFQSQVLARLASIGGIVGLVVSAIIKLALIWSEASLVWFAWVVVVENGVKGGVLSVIYVKQRGPLLKWRFKLGYAKTLLYDSWPLILSGLVIMIYMRIDQVMIKVMLDNKAVGEYAAAVKLSEAWYFVPMAITQSLFPAILSAKKRSEELYYARLQRLYDLMVWLGICVALLITFFHGWVVNFLYGQEYSQAGSILAIHIWAGVFVFVGVASGKWLVSENMQIFAFFRTGLGALFNVILNFSLIPVWGVYGAALATLLSQMIASYLGYACASRTLINFKMQTLSFIWPLRRLGLIKG